MECSEKVNKLEDKHSTNKVEENELLNVRKDILEHLSANESVFFNSVNEEEGKPSKQKKIEIAEELLNRSCGLFLAKFGNHLLKEHLCYFDSRSKDNEDSVIVDLYLKQLNRIHALNVEKKSKIKAEGSIKLSSNEEMEVSSEGSGTCMESEKSKLCAKMLDHLSLSEEAHFKSQQVGEPDLLPREKRGIAAAILDQSPSQFLARFGVHLLEEHLEYFDKRPDEPSDSYYEVEYQLKRLRKTHCKIVSQVGIKNRRFEALKKLVEEGSYFCETEMRNRNPLLYEQLVGKFLSPEERRERLNNVDTTNITFVNLLLEQMDREKVKKLKKEQEDAEDNVMEQDDNISDNEMEEEEEYDSEEDNDLDKSLWGEAYTDGDASGVSSKKITAKRKENKTKDKKNEEEIPELSDAEKQLLMEEFRTNMFSSFLQGKDTNFDYSEVDYNSDYDDLEVERQDAEEKYFDEESSDNASCSKMSDDEDLLDHYMNELRPEPTTQQLAEKMQSLET